VTLPESNDPTATGFRVEGGGLNLGVLTVRSGTQVRKYTGLQASLGVAQLQGVDSLDMIATNLLLQQSKTTVVNGRLMDWSQEVLFQAAKVDLKSTDAAFLIGGTVALGIGEVVYGSATIQFSRTVVDRVTDPDAAGRVLRGDLLSVRVSDARLFIGSGASLDLDRASDDFGKVTLPSLSDPDAVGFRVADGSLDFAVFTARESSESIQTPSIWWAATWCCKSIGRRARPACS